MNAPCEKNDAIDLIREDIKEIKQDVRKLLFFKWQLIGGSIASSFFGSILLTIIIMYLKKEI